MQVEILGAVLLEQGMSLPARIDVDTPPASLVEETGVAENDGMEGADVHVSAHMITEDAVQQNVFPVLSIGNARDFPGGNATWWDRS